MNKMFKTLFIFILCIVLMGCGKAQNGSRNDMSTDEPKEMLVDEYGIVDRKIVYSVNATISTKQFANTVQEIKNVINSSADSWFDNEHITDSYVKFRIRIKSEKLDEFTNTFSNYGSLDHYSKTATDISLTYNDTTSRISTLESELARLNELYEKATINDMIIINKRISEVNHELAYLRRDKTQYDRSIEYSTIDLTINRREELMTGSFWSKIKKGFSGGWSAVIAVLKGLLIAVSAILPFSVILIPIGVTLYAIARTKKKRRNK